MADERLLWLPPETEAVLAKESVAAKGCGACARGEALKELSCCGEPLSEPSEEISTSPPIMVIVCGKCKTVYHVWEEAYLTLPRPRPKEGTRP